MRNPVCVTSYIEQAILAEFGSIGEMGGLHPGLFADNVEHDSKAQGLVHATLG